MFRTIRRKSQALTLEDNVEILNRGTSGVLGVYGDQGYPYTVPLSYVYHNNKIFFHCAKTGHKLDALARSSKVSFCVVDKDQVVPEKLTAYFRSVIVFGRARILDDAAEKEDAIQQLAAKYSPDHKQARLEEITRQFNHLCIVELSIEHISGKESLNYQKQKNRAAYSKNWQLRTSLPHHRKPRLMICDGALYSCLFSSTLYRHHKKLDDATNGNANSLEHQTAFSQPVPARKSAYLMV